MRLIADIGGTNARFALADAEIQAQEQLSVADYPRFEDALTAYLARVPTTLKSAALSVAGPVFGNTVRMTNTPWVVSDIAVHSVYPGIPVRVVNDLAAVALAVPTLRSADVVVMHRGSVSEKLSPIVCINVGTGFGAAVAIPEVDGWCALPTEAGHITLAITNSDERDAFGDNVTVEEVFSGPGLKSLRQRAAAAQIKPEVFQKRFSYVLGRVVGDVTLATGAWGGITLCGGVMDAFDTVVDLEAFLGGLHSRQGLAQQLENVPVQRLICPNPAFRGLLTLTI